MSGKRKAAEKYGEQSRNISAQQNDMLNRMFQERSVYSQKAEDLLGQNPTYVIPEQYQQYQDLMSSLGEQLGSQLSGIAGGLAGKDYTARGEADLRRGYADVSRYANQGAASLRDIMRQGIAESADYAKTGMDRGLSDVQGFTDYYRQMAGRQEMPGQRGLEAKLGRSYAEGYKALSQQAGGGAAGLGAMIDLYSNKSEALSDLGIQAAQYKAQQEAQLGSALERAQAIRSDIYNQMSQGALARSGAMASAEQAATGMQTGAAEAQAQALGQYGLARQGMAQQQAATLADITNQGITGQANLQGAGLLAGAQAADTAYQYNELLPWQQGMNYYTAQIASMNPYGMQQDIFNSQYNSMNALYQLFGRKGRYGAPTA